MRISDLMHLGREAAVFAVSIGVLVMLVWGIGYRFLYKKTMHGKKKLSIKTAVSSGLLLLSILVIIYATLLRGNHWGRRLSLIPFAAYRTAWYQFSSAEWRNIILNICMFVPFGFLLPIVCQRLRSAWKTYLAGFVFTLLIEVFQILFERGIFETDDLINNLLGTMIGYGLAAIFLAVAHRKKGETIRRGTKGILLLQLPLVLCIAFFGIIFISYHRKELGNLIYENTSKHSMPSVECGSDIALSEEELLCDVYKMRIASVEETRAYAEDFFSRQGETIQEQRTDIYDNTAIYYSNDNSLSLWIDYEGLKIWYINSELLHPKDGKTFDYYAGDDEAQVREAIEKTGLTIPKEAVFRENEEGNYSFEAAGGIIEGDYCTGNARCRLNSRGEVAELRYHFVTGEQYSQVPMISSKEAYERLQSGVFYYETGGIPTDSPLTVTGIELVYFPDSKGFFQPVYQFELKGKDGGELQINIAATNT